MIQICRKDKKKVYEAIRKVNGKEIVGKLPGDMGTEGYQKECGCYLCVCPAEPVQEDL